MSSYLFCYHCREMILSSNWPTDMEYYITCDNYTGKNTPKRSIDLRSNFVNIPEPASYGKFSLAHGNRTFNGYSAMSFDMDVLFVKPRQIYQEKCLGNWSVGHTTQLQIESHKKANGLKPTKIYRAYTVLVLL